MFVCTHTHIHTYTRNGWNTSVVVLESALNTFSEVLDGDFKPLISWSTIKVELDSRTYMYMYATILQLSYSKLFSVLSTLEKWKKFYKMSSHFLQIHVHDVHVHLLYMCYNPHLVEQAYQVRNASDTATNIAKATDMPICVHKNSNNNS